MKLKYNIEFVYGSDLFILGLIDVHSLLPWIIFLSFFSFFFNYIWMKEKNDNNCFFLLKNRNCLVNNNTVL